MQNLSNMSARARTASQHERERKRQKFMDFRHTGDDVCIYNGNRVEVVEAYTRGSKRIAVVREVDTGETYEVFYEMLG